jgi:hypothetical protein
MRALIYLIFRRKRRFQTISKTMGQNEICKTLFAGFALERADDLGLFFDVPSVVFPHPLRPVSKRRSNVPIAYAVSP